MYNITLIDNKSGKTSVTTPGEVVKFNAAQKAQVFFRSIKDAKRLVYTYDIWAPDLEITNPVGTTSSRPLFTREEGYLIKGKCHDFHSGVIKVEATIAGTNITVVGDVASDGTWQAVIPLTSEGLKEVKVKAIDRAGNVSSNATCFLRRDTKAPVIKYDEWGVGRGTQASPYFTINTTQKISGTVTDDLSGVKNIRVKAGNNPEIVASVNSSTGKFSVNVNLAANTTVHVQISAEDNVGNITQNSSFYAYADTTVKRVLQVTPNNDNIKTWMESNGYGRNIISVTTVAWDTFMANPYGYLGTSGNWKYDAICLGTWDANNMKAWTDAGVQAVTSFIDSNHGAICGHDVLTGYKNGNTYYYGPWNNGNAPIRNLNGLAERFGLSVDPRMSATIANTSDRVTIQKTGIFTMHPWEIGGVGTVLTIPTTHDIGQIVRPEATIWVTLGSGTNDANRSNYYLESYGNCAMIQTGHSNGSASADEQKIWANILFYLCLRVKSIEITGEPPE